jgi:hypothetical protein
MFLLNISQPLTRSFWFLNSNVRISWQLMVWQTLRIPGILFCTMRMLSEIALWVPIALFCLWRLKQNLHFSKHYSSCFFLQKLIDVLKFPKTKLSSRHVKVHTKRLCDHIENWADVNSTLKGTPYESFLNGRRWQKQLAGVNAVVSLPSLDPLFSLFGS